MIMAGLLLGFPSCTGDFEEIDTSETNPLSGPLPSYFLMMLNKGASGDYQRKQHLYENMYCQYFSDTKHGGDRYVSQEGWHAALWRDCYLDLIPASRLILESTTEAQMNMKAQVIIWRAWILLRITDAYGSIPYFVPLAGTSASEYDFNTPYDTQKEIYYDLFEQLKEAEKMIDDSNVMPVNTFTDADVIYGGDMAKWKKFSASLRLRMAMQISKVDPDKAKAEGESALSSPIIGSNADNAMLAQDFNFGLRHPMPSMKSWREAMMSEPMEKVLEETAEIVDPRQRWFYDPAESDGGYNGLTVGLTRSEQDGMGDRKKIFSNFGPWFDNDKAMDLFVYSEICFLKAEAAMLKWAGAGDMTENYNEGVKASFEHINNTATAEAKKNVGEISEEEMEKYLNSPNVSLEGGEHLRKISTQKWLAVFPDGCVGWASFRRTGFPSELTPPANVSPDCDVPLGKFILRIKYLEQEHDNNGDNVTQALDGKPDSNMTPVWWDVD
ncbi:hypothetical protein FUAX_09310 [Fulvitalea axinellae]|uniref:SusD/RagB family nutrient-binding outer membrane lipoprotein n=2 Tax=Fulvitalea axinellae TaxID=1182444 RepID=A0AAU9CQ40_9BACT|nr:hypothetical protein FUAX_09310 [Fulvitalea axinellae]